MTSRLVGLPAILTAARAGSLTHAWDLFEAGGWAARDRDPAALAVRGRLLGERAFATAASERNALLAAAAAAYTASATLRPSPHALLAAASCAWLAGDRAAGAAGARAVLETLAQSRDDTPYFLAAARAEALLLTNDAPGAAAALAEAVRANPGGWEDRAVTLRQLARIIAAQGGDAGWLDRFRPPVSLSFAGHLGVDPAHDADLRAALDARLAQSDVGFGYGALAAGADIVIAEALLARGAELHLVLPLQRDAFIAQSVTPYDPAWRPRFEACLAAAASVRTLTSVSGAYEPLATQLAADVAMGGAVLNARRLESRAEQVLVIDQGPAPYGHGSGTAAIGRRWRDAGAQHLIVAPRDAPVAASGRRASPEGRPDRRLAAMLRLEFAGLTGADDAQFAEALDTLVAPFDAPCRTCEPKPCQLPMGNARLLVFADPDQALRWAIDALHRADPALGLCCTGHYALAHWREDPAALVGPAIAELEAIAIAALPGVLTASGTFAAAVAVNNAAFIRAEPVGECAGAPILTLRWADQ